MKHKRRRALGQRSWGGLKRAKYLRKNNKKRGRRGKVYSTSKLLNTEDAISSVRSFHMEIEN